MLTLPGCGKVSLWDHVHREKLRQNLGIQAIGLPSGFGDDPELVGIGQNNLLGNWFHESNEPVVASRGLDDDLERLKLLEKRDDLIRVVAMQSSPRNNLEFVADDTNCDNLLVEVDADRVHLRAPSLG